MILIKGNTLNTIKRWNYVKKINPETCLNIILSIFIMSIFIISGCSTKHTTVVLLSDNDNSVGKVELKNEYGTALITRHRESVTMKLNKPPANPVEMSEEEINATFSQAIAAKPETPAKFMLHFEQGSDIVIAEDRKLITEIIEAIKKRQSTDISINGHSDRLGNEEDNERLSLKRANKILQIIVENDIDPSLIKVTSHGEGNPIIPTEDNVAEPLNRRVEVIVR